MELLAHNGLYATVRLEKSEIDYAERVCGLGFTTPLDKAMQEHFENDLDELRSERDDAKGELEDIQGALSQLEDKLELANAEIQELQLQLEVWESTE